MNQESSSGFSSFLLSTMGFVDQLTRLLTEWAYFCLIGFRVIETSAADRQDSVDRLIFLIIKVQIVIYYHISFLYLYKDCTFSIYNPLKEHLLRCPGLLKSQDDLGPIFSAHTGCNFVFFWISVNSLARIRSLHDALQSFGGRLELDLESSNFLKVVIKSQHWIFSGISLQTDVKREPLRGRVEQMRARSNTESSLLASPAAGGRRRKDSLWTKMSFLPKWCLPIWSVL